MQVIYTNSSSLAASAYVKRAAEAARGLRAVLPLAYPLVLAGVPHTFSLLDTGSQKAWDRHITIEPSVGRLDGAQLRILERIGTAVEANRNPTMPYAPWKLLGLLSSPFRRTLFLDVDVFVLDRSLAPSLLERSLRLADVAMPVDAGRQNHAGDWWQRMAGTGPLCSAVVAFQSNAATQTLFRGALRQLLARSHPEACVDYTPEHARRRNVSRKISCQPMRQGDQMYIMMEWIRAADPALRVVALPEEYYCPSMRLSGANPQSLHAEWANSYSQRLENFNKKYHCRAVHGRFLLSEPDRRAGGMPHLKPPGA